MSKWLIPLLTLLACIGFSPQIASSRFGKPFIEKILERKTDGKIKIKSLDFSWLGPQRFYQVEWEHDFLQGTIQEFQIDAPFWKFSGPFHLKMANVQYPGGKIDQIHGQIEGNDFNLHGVTLEGHLALKGKIYAKHHFNIQIDITELPLMLIDHTLDRFIGPTINFSGNIQMNQGEGNLDLIAFSPILQSKIKARFNTKIATLIEPIKITVRSEIFELAQLMIAPDGFSFPIPYDLDQIAVKHAHLNLGKIQYKTEESFDLFDLISISKEKTINLWCAPCNLSLQKGKLHLERLDLLIDRSIHLCTWGEIDLPKERLHLFLGLPKDTLEKSFGIKNLPSEYVLKVAVGGTFENPDIAKKSAMAKIGALIAANKVPKNKILKGLSHVITSPKIDKDVPSANRPFPWEQS